MKKTKSNFQFYFSSKPWGYFFLFLIVNSFLSYSSFSIHIKLWMGFLGLLLPFGIAWLTSRPIKQADQSMWKKEFLPPISVWIWVTIGIATVFVRFYQLTTLSVWPHYDEALWSFLAIDFYHKWDWSLFYQDNPYPSVYFWGLGFLFKLFQPSVFWVWFYPALFSTLAVPAGYFAARQYFSKSVSFLIIVFLALSFWPVFIGRFVNLHVLTLLMEFLLLFFLGRFLKASSFSDAKKEVFLLGLLAASGFYIYISWVAIAVFASLAVIAVWWKKPVQNLNLLLIYFLTALLAIFPLLQAGLVKNYLRTVHDIGTFYSFPFAERISIASGYISALFWGVSSDIFTYKPVWGGLLNPVLGSLFMVGLLWLFRVWHFSISKWFLVGLVLFYIPAVFTHDLEPFRIFPLIPFLLAICALGLQYLFKNIPPKKGLLWILPLVLFVASLDFYHLVVRYHRIWDQESVWRGYAKPMERYRAFGILDKIRKEKGPGLIYSDFTPGLCDQTLTVADHAFNAAQNPDLSYRDAQWVAVLINVNYKPFLSARFPDGKAYSLSAGLSTPDGGQMLWVMPVTNDKTKILSQWQTASDSFCCFPGRYNEILKKNLVRAYEFYRGDPFLESCFWEKLADLEYKTSNFKNFKKPIEDLIKGIKEGYPSAHLYQKLGIFYLMDGNIQQGEKALKKALQAPLNLTQSRQLLQSIPIRQPSD